MKARLGFAASMAAALLVTAPAAAQDKPPVPKMLQGMGAQKGQWRVDLLEGGVNRPGAPTTMTLCTDNLVGQASGSAPRGAPKSQSSCQHRLLKDTSSEAVIETTCKDRTSTVTMTREDAKTVLMDMASTGRGGPHHMKMRYTSLGPCREGQGPITFDPDSAQCRRMKAQAQNIDPEKSCARESAHHEECLQRMREMASRLSSMCR